ncbi:MAG: sigma 54-dependent Fis family transcriptional regulator [Myxococcaceae bacterium]|nr:sigma 54-dependent Fis family transcriptional regulator [Myxococcaceae bacterium]
MTALPTHDTQPHGSSQTAAGPMVRRFKLTVLEPEAGRTWESTQDRCAIGQHALNQFVIDDPTVSRFHCEIEMSAEGARLRDVGSLNGVLVDGLKVFDAMLRGGSLIRLGRIVLRFDFLLESNLLAVSPHQQFGPMRGASVPMRTCFSVLERAASSDATVLLEGETGTGKSLAARAIHQASARKGKPFYTIDCASLPATLLDSELFGYEKGAFSGAAARRIGLFEEADGGTIFIDEIGELPLELQPKLLHALEMREVRRLGSNQYVKVDVRVIAATHRDLRAEVNAGRFRPDLFYRLAVVRATLPSLRSRPEDIPLVARGLLEGLQAPPGAAERLLTPDLVHRLQREAWRGNVRELRNYLERCVVFERELELGEPPGATEQRDPLPVDTSRTYADARRLALDAFEKRYLETLLAAHDGNVTAASQAAEIDRVYFHRLLRRHRP